MELNRRAYSFLSHFLIKGYKVLFILVIPVISFSEVRKYLDVYMVADTASFTWVKVGSHFYDNAPPISGTHKYFNKKSYVVDSFSSPDTCPWGLAYDNGYLWHSDSEAKKIYKINPSTGAAISQFAAPDDWTKDLAFDGTYLWACGNYQSKIYKLDTLGNVIFSFRSPESNPLGLTFDGTYLWHTSYPGTDAEPTKVYKITISGSIVSSFDLPFQWADGLAWCDSFLLITNSEDGNIYKINPLNGSIVDAYGTPHDYPLGITYDSSDIWVIDRNHNYIYWYSLDNTPPALALNSPHNLTTFPAWCPIDIAVIVKSSNLSFWCVEYAQGEVPSFWNIIDSLHHTNVVWDTLSWQVSGVTENDIYWVRLNVNFTDGSIDTSSKAKIYIDPYIRYGWPKVYLNLSPVAFADLGDGNRLIGNSSSKIVVWDASGNEVWLSPVNIDNTRIPVTIGNVDKSGFYEIATGYPPWAMGDSSVRVNLITYQDGVCPNWPRYGKKTDDYWATIIPVFSDMDLDGKIDIFVGGRHLYGWHHTGVPFFTTQIGYNVSDPAIGDIDGDGHNDFIFKSDSSLFVCSSNGDTLPGFPVYIKGAGYTSPVIGDINNDGKMEIVVIGYRWLYVISDSGSVLPGWPKWLTGFYISPPVLGDIDNNGDLEIVQASCNEIYVFNHDGSLFSGWPVTVDGVAYKYNAPVIGDVDGDNFPDILLGFAVSNNFEEIYAWDRNGQILSGWPRKVSAGIYYGICGSPVLGDFDSDGNVDVAVSSNSQMVENTEVYVWSLPFPYNTNTMEWPTYRHDIYRTGNYHYFVDVVPPNVPIDLTANGSSPSPWTNDSMFVINWINPPDTSGIAKALYKLDLSPTNNYDTTGSISRVPPDTLFSSAESARPLYVWLVDSVGNTDYTNNSSVNLRHDTTAPTSCVASSPDMNKLLAFTVNWSAGTDSLSGITGRYDVRADSGAGWYDWLQDTLAIFANYTGIHGHPYYFEAVAEDSAGNVELFTGVAECSTLIDTTLEDTIAPGPPQNLTANGSNPSPWMNDSVFIINWTNPLDMSGIAKALYKLDTLPTDNYDTTGSMSGTPPTTVYSSVEGERLLYMWLVDGDGNVDYNNNSFVNIRYDTTSPIIDSTTILQDTVNFWGPFEAKTKITDNAPFNNPIMFYRTSVDTEWVIDTMTSLGGGWFVDSIPELPHDSLVVDYYLTVEDFATNTSREPNTGLYSFVIRHEVGVEDKKVPDKFVLFPPTPNPSLGSVVIKYGLPEKATVSLRLYDISGRVVKTLYSGTQEKGYYKVDIKNEELAKGIYFIKFQAGKYKVTKKLILVR